eukprot:TRINITY_DN3825_c0_g1_i1.p1 TRINITY_DN3825_c0_g1~~TRINITY_DN3825_c0_g1_i1.p1  ORF type:complete len:694 (+),score=214.97 TRINITY_DN3825_c0_g1_i1:156-2237(+)
MVLDLFSAAQGLAISDVYAALAEGADINAVDGNGNAMIHIACIRQSTELLQIALEKGANVNICDHRGNTPLHIAARRNDPDIATTLIQNGANIDAISNDGNTPLMVAIMWSHEQLARDLVEAGANVKLANSAGADALRLMPSLTSHKPSSLSKLRTPSRPLLDVSPPAEPGTPKFRLLPPPTPGSLSKPLRSSAESANAEFVPAAVVTRADASTETAGARGVSTGVQSEPSHKDLQELAQVLSFSDVLDEEDEKRFAEANDGLESLTLFERADHMRVPPASGTLHAAALENNVELIGVIAADGGDVNQRSAVGDTALHLAVREGCGAAVQCLLQHGAQPDFRDSTGHTALHIAAAWLRAPEVKLLLNGNASVNATDSNGSTALHIAVRRQAFDIVESLLQGNADVNQQNKVGNSPLHVAAMWRLKEPARLLIMAGANVHLANSGNKSPIELMSDLKSVVAEVEEIKRQQALEAVRARNAQSQRMLATAAKRDFLGAMAMLETDGADVNAVAADGECFLTYVLQVSDSADVVQGLLSRGARVYSGDERHAQPLHTACRHGRMQSLSVLLETNPPLNHADASGSTPLHVAVFWRRLDIVGKLLAAGAQCDVADFGGNSPLHLASKHNLVPIAKLLLEHGASVNMCNAEQNTPLITACIWQQADVARLLLLKGADVSMKNNVQRTAAQFFPELFKR